MSRHYGIRVIAVEFERDRGIRSRTLALNWAALLSPGTLGAKSGRPAWQNGGDTLKQLRLPLRDLVRVNAELLRP